MYEYAHPCVGCGRGTDFYACLYCLAAVEAIAYFLQSIP